MKSENPKYLVLMRVRRSACPHLPFLQTKNSDGFTQEGRFDAVPDVCVLCFCAAFVLKTFGGDRKRNTVAGVGTAQRRSLRVPFLVKGYRRNEDPVKRNLCEKAEDSKMTLSAKAAL